MRYIYLLALFFCFSVKAQNTFTVYFDFDIDEVNNTSSYNLSRWIADNKNALVEKIYGYADSTGNFYYNIDLSERRAEYVLQQLEKNGIATVDSLDIKGFGEDFPLSSNMAKNRKAIIHYTVVKQESAFEKAVKEAKKGDKLKLPNLYFYNNSDVVLPKSKPVLEELLKVLKETPELKIQVQGHICCQQVEQNQISLKRAMAVYNFLILNGIDKSRLSYKSFGSTRPIYSLPEKSEDERVANRRVEIEIQ
ncbi:OmpA family protein [Flavobacterium sp. MK4S-17]|uniref:OmpA family protein n=1 Tax=Flavobacterium sp. MK4S-17 TaxID=2543737 RepID=UPI001357D626|nr:OmpA family protein [Flavobacterium sp. MK4S-17]